MLFLETLEVNPEVKAKLLSTVENNLFTTLHEDFSSAYKIGKFIKSSENYVAPVKVKLPPSEDGRVATFQYVPVLELVPLIARQPGFGSKASPPSSDMLHDVQDGTAIEDNQYFKVQYYPYFLKLEVCTPIVATVAACTQILQ